MIIWFECRLVCDSWLQLEFPLALAAETLLMKVANIHFLWESLLQMRLEGKQVKPYYFYRVKRTEKITIQF